MFVLSGRWTATDTYTHPLPFPPNQSTNQPDMIYSVAVLGLLATAAQGKTYFKEDFNGEWLLVVPQSSSPH